MTRLPTRLLALLVFGLLVGCSRRAPPLDTLKAKTTEMVALVRSRQYEDYVDLLYPAFVKMAGGRAALIEEMHRAYREATEHDETILAINVGDPTDAVTSGGKVFAIVPMATTLDTPAATVTRKGYLVAISADNGATWKFLEGSELNTAQTCLLVPDLPSSLKFPKDEAPVVVNKPTPEPRQPAAPLPAVSRSALQIKTIEVANDMVAGAYHSFVAALYPPMVEGLGGPDKAAALLERGVRASLAAGRVVTSSAEVDEPGRFATQGKKIFAVVPVTLKGENAQHKMTRHTAFLAVSGDGGATWSFIPGISPKVVASLPGSFLPPDLKIPESLPDVITNK